MSQWLWSHPYFKRAPSRQARLSWITNSAADCRTAWATGIPALRPTGCTPAWETGGICAIAVFSDDEWNALCRVMGQPTWSEDPRFASFLHRSHNQTELDQLISQWTRQLNAEDIMEKLQGAGVPASIVSQGEDLYTSAHLHARGFYKPHSLFRGGAR